MASNEKYTILYGRLSQEDTQKTNKTDDSNSIQNQKLLLEKYAAEKMERTKNLRPPTIISRRSSVPCSVS